MNQAYGGVPSMGWREFARGWGQDTIGQVTSGILAAQGADHGLATPESSIWKAIPEHTKQPISNSQTATGLPFRLTNPSTGAVNWVNVGIVGLGIMLVIKAVKS